MARLSMINGRLAAALMALLLVAWPAYANASCEGESFFHRLRDEDPDTYFRILAEGEKVLNGDGNFWKIEAPGVAPSYLLGTFHSPLATPHVPEKAWEALAHARIALFEITQADADEYFHTQQDMSATHDWTATPLRNKLTQPERYALDLVLAERGMVASEVDFMRSTLLYQVLAYPVCHQRLVWSGDVEILDSAIEIRASASGVPVASLETIPDQDEALNKMPPESIVRMLVGDARYLNAQDDIFQSFVDLYAEGDNGTSFAFEIWLADQINETDIGNELFFDFDTWLLDHRNRAWLPRLEQEIGQGGAFVAVGAAHIAREFGLVALLQAKGFMVERLD